MSDWAERVDRLDPSVFDGVPSQTTMEDRRTLLAVQRSVAARRGRYVYLEVGSYLGGTITPHAGDARCVLIYSIDARKSEVADDRPESATITYAENSAAEMRRHLSAVVGDGVAKVHSFDATCDEVRPEDLQCPADLVMIDGEHTHGQVLRDFAACRKWAANDGVFLFHDYGVVYRAIDSICRNLRRERKVFAAAKLEGGVFGIAFDPGVFSGDEHLSRVVAGNKTFRARFFLRRLAGELRLRRGIGRRG